jgi:hypothetical protein
MPQQQGNVCFVPIVLKNSKIAGASKISQMMHFGDFSRCKAL